MKQVLIIEDDATTANLYRQHLDAKGFAVEVAEDGRKGLDLATRHRPGLVILDLILPELSGLDVLKALRADTACSSLPILVLSKADSRDIAQQAFDAGATEVLTKASCTPRQVADIVCHLTSGGQGEATKNDPSDDDFQAELRESCLTSGPAWLQAIRSSFQIFSNDLSDTAVLHNLHRNVHSMAGNAGLSGLQTVHAVGSTLESLIEESGERRDRITPSLLRTVAQSIDLLDALFRKPLPTSADVAPKADVLAIDDQDIALRAMSYSLQKAKLTPTAVKEPATALSLAAGKVFDLVVTDIDMPGMTGIELCTKLRALPGYKTQPILFVTNAADYDNRVKAVLSGGTDLIAKPYLFHELALKALTLLVRSRIPKP